MDDPVEELEPLFDYSRVQPMEPIILDDDNSMEAVPISAGEKRKRKSAAKDNEQKKQSDIVNLDDDCDVSGRDQEDDWLDPPPKIVDSAVSFEDDKIIQELRLKKQELTSLAESAEMVLKTVMENAKKEHSRTTAHSVEEDENRPTKPQPERQKIIISIQDKDGSKQFRIYKDDKLEKLFKMYAEKANTELVNLVFTFDGDKVQNSATPISLGLEDDDMIEVHHKA